MRAHGMAVEGKDGVENLTAMFQPLTRPLPFALEEEEDYLAEVRRNPREPRN
jgi:hypothetical protein